MQPRPSLSKFVQFSSYGIWFSLHHRPTQVLLNSWANGDAKTILRLGRADYEVDFQEMVQKAVDTGNLRKIRFFGLWDFEEDDGRWQPIFPQWCVELTEALWAGKTTCQMHAKSGAVYEVDFEKSVQRNKDTGRERPVRVRPWAVLACSAGKGRSASQKCVFVLESD